MKTFNERNSILAKAMMAFACILLLSACSESEADLLGSVRGRIVSMLNEEPQQGVSVTLTPGGKSTITGSDGYFEFVELTPGQYSLQAQKADFKTNYKQITVVAGQVALGDLSLEPLQTVSSVEITPLSIDFGSTLTESLISIRNTGSSGSIEWTISGVTVDWLQIAPQSGQTGQGMTSSVRVLVDRVSLKSAATTYFTVNYPGGSASVRVSASPAN